jgi:hypothetical protein
MLVLLDHLPANLDPAMSASRAANDIVPHTNCWPPPERLVQCGGVDAVQPDQLLGNDDRVAVEDLGGAGEGLGTPAERHDSKETGRETPEHRAT